MDKHWMNGLNTNTSMNANNRRMGKSGLLEGQKSSKQSWEFHEF
jgi:hypothetical protein